MMSKLSYNTTVGLPVGDKKLLISEQQFPVNIYNACDPN